MGVSGYLGCWEKSSCWYAGAPTHFMFANPVTYHEILGSVRWRSRISLFVRPQEKSSVTVQVYKSRKNTWGYFVGDPRYPGCQKKNDVGLQEGAQSQIAQLYWVIKSL